MMRILEIQEQNNRAARERKEVAELTPRLEAAGILAVYGGGSRSKGHGFWLYTASAETIKRWGAFHGWSSLKNATVIRNDGKKSGNPLFTMFEDAVKLIEEA